MKDSRGNSVNKKTIKKLYMGACAYFGYPRETDYKISRASARDLYGWLDVILKQQPDFRQRAFSEWISGKRRPGFFRRLWGRVFGK